MGDEDRGNAVVLEAADDREQLFDLGPAQRRGRFVHHDKARLHRQCARNFDQLLLGHRKVSHQRTRAALQPNAVRQHLRLRLKLPAADEQPGAGLSAHKDVLCHRHVGGQRELLVDRHDAAVLGILGTGKGDIGAVETDRSTVWRHRPGKDLQQSGFAGPVFADEGVNLGLSNLEVNRVERTHAGVGLRDPRHAKQQRAGRDVHGRPGIPATQNLEFKG